MLKIYTKILRYKLSTTVACFHNGTTLAMHIPSPRQLLTTTQQSNNCSVCPPCKFSPGKPNYLRKIFHMVMSCSTFSRSESYSGVSSFCIETPEATNRVWRRSIEQRLCKIFMTGFQFPLNFSQTQSCLLDIISAQLQARYSLLS